MCHRREPGAVLASMLAILALGSCDRTGPGITPRELEIISGGGQTTRRGDDVLEPLRVRIIGSDGHPLPGATVQWSVTQGQATLEPPQNTTSSTGEASTRVTNVAVIGAVVVRASVLGANDAALSGTFSITALDPCLPSTTPTYPFGNPVTGVLGPLDCILDDGSPLDTYILSLTAQEAVAIRLRSDRFVPGVGLLTVNDLLMRGIFYDGRPGEGALMKAILAPGAYVVGVLSFNTDGTGGPYELLVSATSAKVTCDVSVLLVRGIATAQELSSTDCHRQVSDASSAPYEDWFWLVLHAGERAIMTQSSTQFGPRLRLQWRSGALVGDADGTVSGTATIDFTADSSGLYRISASSALAQQLGEYTLAVSYAPGAAPSATAASASRITSLSHYLHRRRGQN